MENFVVLYMFAGGFLAGYLVFGGAKLGASILFPLFLCSHDRQRLIKSLGPFWNGHELWLVAGCLTLFGAFPPFGKIIATACSVPGILLIVVLLFRLPALKYCGHYQEGWYATLWIWVLSMTSILIVVLLGMLAGNVLRGIPINAEFELMGSWVYALNPYALLCGLFMFALFATHGACYLSLKTQGDLHNELRLWFFQSYGALVLLYLLVLLTTGLFIPAVGMRIVAYPWIVLLIVFNGILIANTGRAIHARHPLEAFLSSAAMIFSLIALFGWFRYPHILVSSIDPEVRLSLNQAAADDNKLHWVLNITKIIMPALIAYTLWVWYLFRGKVAPNIDA